MAEKKEEIIEKEAKKSNSLLITCLVIVLMGVCSVGGFLIGSTKIVTKYNNHLEKSMKEANTEKETTKEETTEKETVKEEIKDTTNCKEEKAEETTIDNSNTVEKVYGWYNDTITLFKSGKCVVTKGSEYTNACKYTINNNTLTMTRRETGPNNGTETTYIYNITTDSNNTEYLELSTNKETKYKLFD